MMKRTIWMAVIAAAMLAFAPMAPTGATERTVTLDVRMVCPFCQYNVTRVLTSVPGVKDVRVSLRHQSAVVTFDDTVTEVSTVVEATQRYGYRSKVLSGTEASARRLATLRTNAPKNTQEQSVFRAFLGSLWSRPTVEEKAQQ